MSDMLLFDANLHLDESDILGAFFAFCLKETNNYKPFAYFVMVLCIQEYHTMYSCYT